MGFDVGDVGHPDLVRLRGAELLLQPVLSHNGRLAAVPAGRRCCTIRPEGEFPLSPAGSRFTNDVSLSEG